MREEKETRQGWSEAADAERRATRSAKRNRRSRIALWALLAFAVAGIGAPGAAAAEPVLEFPAEAEHWQGSWIVPGGGGWVERLELRAIAGTLGVAGAGTMAVTGEISGSRGTWEILRGYATGTDCVRFEIADPRGGQLHSLLATVSGDQLRLTRIAGEPGGAGRGPGPASGEVGRGARAAVPGVGNGPRGPGASVAGPQDYWVLERSTK